jgi:SAM-dependent MidA family methyltransferase
MTVHLVEASPKLQEKQREKFADTDKIMVWHRRLNDMPTAPGIFLANEFFDALPIRQAVRQADGWHERTVEIGENDALQFGLDPSPLTAFEETLPPAVRHAPIGSIFEWRSPRDALELGRRVAKRGAGLVIDYGHAKSDVGETLQAVRSRRYDGPLACPGLADLSAHVDFEALEIAIGGMGARVEKLVDQGSFLHRLGIEARAETLKANADARGRAGIDSAVARLTSMNKTGMGRMFKVLGFADSSLPPLPGFDG